MNNWQPIETAPRDKTQILVSWKTKRDASVPAGAQVCSTVRFVNDRWAIGNSTDGQIVTISDPTHWMPLPEPPVQS